MTIGLHMCINFMGAVVSVLLLKAIHLEEYQEVIMNGADSQAVMDYMMEVPAGLDRLYDLCIVYSGSIGYGESYCSLYIVRS